MESGDHWQETSIRGRRFHFSTAAFRIRLATVRIGLTSGAQILAQGIKNAILLNKIKEVSFRANIEPVWNAKVCGTPFQLGFLELNYFSGEERGGVERLAFREASF